MGMYANELLEYVIHPTLQYLGLQCPEAEYVLLGLAGSRSTLGGHLEDHGGLGIYAIDRDTHRTLWDRFLAYRPDLASRVRGLASQHEFLAHPDAELATNLSYSTAIAWCQIASAPEQHCISVALHKQTRAWLAQYAMENMRPAPRQMAIAAVAA